MALCYCPKHKSRFLPRNAYNDFKISASSCEGNIKETKAYGTGMLEKRSLYVESELLKGSPPFNRLTVCRNFLLSYSDHSKFSTYLNVDMFEAEKHML